MAYGERVETIYLVPPKKDFSKLCDKQELKKYYFGKSWYRETRIKGSIYDSNYPANVTDVRLDKTEIIADCNLINPKNNKNCSNDNREIKVSVVAVDAENDVLTYIYKVSGGKIIGQGADVVWDLSEVKAGIYAIMAAVDDGCGLCGKYITKTVTIKE